MISNKRSIAYVARGESPWISRASVASVGDATRGGCVEFAMSVSSAMQRFAIFTRKLISWYHEAPDQRRDHLVASEAAIRVADNPVEDAPAIGRTLESLIYPVGFYRTRRRVIRESART